MVCGRRGLERDRKRERDQLGRRKRKRRRRRMNERTSEPLTRIMGMMGIYHLGSMERPSSFRYSRRLSSCGLKILRVIRQRRVKM
jgi:hypothetical protein